MKLLDTVQGKISESSKNLALFLFKLISGMIIGLVLALVGQEIIGFSNLSFFLVIIIVTGVFLRVVRSWNFLMMILFDLFAVVGALLLKMYILMAP